MIEEILAYPQILVIGYPGSGKTTLALKLAAADEQRRSVVHSDSFMNEGWEQSLYSMIEAIDFSAPYIVEGVQGYRLLRKMLERNIKLPDVIVLVEASEEQYKKRYRDRNKPVPLSMFKALDKVYSDFCRACTNMPKIIIYRSV